MSYFRHNDPDVDFARYNQAMEDKLERRPICSCCQRHIRDNTAFHYGDIWLCLDCIDDNMELIEE